MASGLLFVILNTSLILSVKTSIHCKDTKEGIRDSEVRSEWTAWEHPSATAFHFHSSTFPSQSTFILHAACICGFSNIRSTLEGTVWLCLWNIKVCVEVQDQPHSNLPGSVQPSFSSSL